MITKIQLSLLLCIILLKHNISGFLIEYNEGNVLYWKNSTFSKYLIILDDDTKTIHDSLFDGAESDKFPDYFNLKFNHFGQNSMHSFKPVKNNFGNSKVYVIDEITGQPMHYKIEKNENVSMIYLIMINREMFL